MQNRYVGDIGDFIKLALLRHVGSGRRLGVAWYLYPDEDHNSDGRHISYLRDHARWRHLDPELHDGLNEIVKANRSVAWLERAGFLTASYSGEILVSAGLPPSERSTWRTDWFRRVLADLTDAEIVFADPDNGLVDDEPRRRRTKRFGKQLPLDEARRLADGRSAILYHHNTRFKGGHDAEIDHWLKRLGYDTLAVRANSYSCRTFFILNPDGETVKRAESFCDKWSGHGVRLHANAARHGQACITDDQR